MLRGKNMSTILLSIKPEYSNRILEGIKKFEYRKRIAQEPVDTIIIYSTSPEMKVVGKAEVLDILSDSPESLWEQTKENSGISFKKFIEYFKNEEKAYAYKLGEIELFEPYQDLSDYNVRMAPQSFVYIDRESRAQ